MPSDAWYVAYVGQKKNRRYLPSPPNSLPTHGRARRRLPCGKSRRASRWGASINMGTALVACTVTASNPNGAGGTDGPAARTEEGGKDSHIAHCITDCAPQPSPQHWTPEFGRMRGFSGCFAHAVPSWSCIPSAVGGGRASQVCVSATGGRKCSVAARVTTCEPRAGVL